MLCSGKIKPGLFQLEDGGVEISSICQAVNHVLDITTAEQKSQLQYPLDAREWRCWSNPEFLLRPLGVRLEELSEEMAKSVLAVVEATFSPEGFEKALAAMRINHFLGEICDVSNIMNKYSYNFLLFGTPSTTEPWGWALYGHHMCLSVFLKGSHISITPTFTGAEPNLIDSGEFKDTAILHQEGDIGLRLMQSLTPEQQQKAQTYKLLRDPQMLQSGDLKVDRWNQDDQRHVCGAFRDNRVVPYEGVLVESSFSSAQTNLLLEIVEQFVLYLPLKARQLRLDQVRRHLHETYFSWIGGFGNEDPFYFRIQNPVIICEFDHHSGVFLTNTEPAKFHTHTIVRTPNGGDYGNALRSDEEKIP